MVQVLLGSPSCDWAAEGAGRLIRSFGIARDLSDQFDQASSRSQKQTYDADPCGVTPVIQQGPEQPSGYSAGGEHKSELAVAPNLNPRALLAVGILIGTHAGVTEDCTSPRRARRAGRREFPVAHRESRKQGPSLALRITPLDQGRQTDLSSWRRQLLNIRRVAAKPIRMLRCRIEVRRGFE